MAVKARWDHSHGEVGLLRKWRLGWARLFGGSLGELREGESPSGEEMARMVQEGLPPGSQSMPTSRPLRSPPPVPRALVGLKAADPVTSNRQKPVLTPWDGPEQRHGAGGGVGGRRPAMPAELCSPKWGSAGTRGRRLPPGPGPCRRAYLCPRLGSSSLALPQPGLRYREGSPEPRASAPSSSSSSSSSSTSSASWMATRICTAVSGPDSASSPGWAMARGPAGSPRREAEPAGRGLLRRGGGGDASGSAPEGRGSRRPAPRRRCHHPDGLPSASADGVA